MSSRRFRRMDVQGSCSCNEAEILILPGNENVSKRNKKKKETSGGENEMRALYCWRDFFFKEIWPAVSEKV